MNKAEFMHVMQQELRNLNPADITDILADFAEHFANGRANGKSEAEVAAELGNPAEIARQYLDGIGEETLEHSTSPVSDNKQQVDPISANPAAAGTSPADMVPPVSHSRQPTVPAGRVKGTALAIVILINVLLGIPIWISLFSTLCGFWAAAGGIGVASAALFTAAILQSGITSLILALFGLSLIALTILSVILMVFLTKWLFVGLARYIRWNKKLVMGGNLA